MTRQRIMFLLAGVALSAAIGVAASIATPGHLHVAQMQDVHQIGFDVSVQ